MSDQKICLEQPIIAESLEAIRELGREFGVLRLEVFGSVCTPDFDPETSDVDFLVEYPEDYDFGPWIARYFAFKEALSRLLGRPVGLIMASAPRNVYFARSIDRTRRLLYAARDIGSLARCSRRRPFHRSSCGGYLRGQGIRVTAHASPLLPGKAPSPVGPGEGLGGEGQARRHETHHLESVEQPSIYDNPIVMPLPPWRWLPRFRIAHHPRLTPSPEPSPHAPPAAHPPARRSAPGRALPPCAGRAWPPGRRAPACRSAPPARSAPAR